MAANNNKPAQVFKHSYGQYDGHLIKPDPEEHYTHAIVEFEDGRTRRQEFPIGSGYLSQSSRVMLATPDMKSITWFRGSKKGKKILLIDKAMFGKTGK